MFEKLKTNNLKMKVGDLSPKKIAEFTLPVLTAGIENQGLNNYAPRDNATILKNVISISANGANTGATFYQNKEFTVLQDAYAISFKEEYTPNDNQYLFLTGAIAKSIYGNFAWTDKAGWEKVKKEFIQLPTKDGKIDFEFMDACIRELEEERIRELEEERIRELEEERIRELSAYLTVSGLDNYELSSEEKEALNAYDSIMFGECKFKDIFNKIKIGDLFEIKPTKAYKLTNEDLFEKNGLYPVVTNSSVNNGITGYTNLSPTEKGNMITYSDTTTSDGIFYQPTDYVGYSHIQGLYPLVYKEKWEYKSLMYIVTCFRKSASGRFDYGNKFNRNIAKEMSIQLPTKDGKIDFEFMELLISAVQKLVIKDVVLYADEKIQSTKKIVKEN